MPYKKGFTLIELLVVIAIIGILSGLIIISMNVAINASKDAKRKSDIGVLQRSLMIYGVQNGNTYPSTDTYPCTIGGGTTPCTNLATDLQPYLPSLPVDPNGGYYTYNYADGNFTVSATLSSGDSYSYSSSGGFANWACGDALSYSGKSYDTILIGTQCWMKENLNHQTGNSWCYNDNTANCDTYGRLYDAATAQSVCPSGWRLPSDADFGVLFTLAGNDMNKLRAVTPDWDGEDTYGFALVPAGRLYNSVYENLGSTIGLWTTDVVSSYHLVREFFTGVSTGMSHSGALYEVGGFSVRCLKN
ncbi:MAG: FISUMP domain-containing protein [Candidatus Paceibacterota bacterium]